jgi:hypothetical protein
MTRGEIFAKLRPTAPVVCAKILPKLPIFGSCDRDNARAGVN